ncbi:hypothetical protein GCM10007916_27780 [Psychromonas marina]|uniref:Histidine phosphatase family protein n=1 Tax=Psychromonas marina TaxID=88364 RepID=A0ABQ6E3D6_9GAMM|nr:hypothetical protein [Psychromonas marina]GLS91708.1 hypothetical protein GCM10007916_27780 [Psychromonas marina]
MNILVLRHSDEQVKLNGKRDVISASQLEHATGYALNRYQLAATSVGDSAYIIDRTNNIAFFGEIISIVERYVTLKNGNKDRRQDLKLQNVKSCKFVDVPFVKGWETQRGVKVLPRIEFDKIVGSL